MKCAIPIRRPARLPTSPDTFGRTFERFLAQFDRASPRTELEARLIGVSVPVSIPYVHPRCVTFAKTSQRQTYLARTDEKWHHDLVARDTFEEFWQGPKRGAKTWIALFAAPQDGLHNGRNMDMEIWHAFALLIIKSPSGYGKHVVIWDCDCAEQLDLDDGHRMPRPRATHVLTGCQKELLRFIKKKKSSFRLWYNTDASWRYSGRCVQASMLKVKNWFSCGDLPYGGEKDARLNNCVELSLT
ncbi:uncharacterized protein B0I36DRAFT_256833 [Microdochium trichocladiopsis]|uniref:Uncharacterized protein n=1 Tax=Microdochium trichocladiopsis TaxID=1682393 RepID=A0A9P8XRY1_9PEZI|nr:uncharacterized protein B0I36DRAFT_256833 [Microdochium trichocladiopsis]KAH7012037.1 hypothetical protein B0I36DRAFT_256833 [Microdochium trichocladiopsis]